MFLFAYLFPVMSQKYYFILLKSYLFCLLFSNDILVSNVELPLTPSVEEYSSADEPEDVEDISNDTEEGESRHAKYLSFNAAYFDFDT